MIPIGQSLLSTIAALAATLLGLSLLIQVIQEVYKFLTSSQARAYRITLLDFLGPWAARIFDPGTATDLKLRGPFQFLKLRPPSRLLPLDKDDLVDALERTLSPWHREALLALRLEAKRQAEEAERGIDGARAAVSPDPSSALTDLAKRLTTSVPGAPGHRGAQEIHEFLAAWMPVPSWPSASTGGARGGAAAGSNRVAATPAASTRPLDAAALLAAFRAHFMPHIVSAADHYAHLMRNYEHNSRRRNLRQTFTFALLLALAFDLPFGRLYNEARRVPPDQAFEMLAAASAAYDTVVAGGDTLRVVTRVLPPRVQAYAEAMLDSAVKRDSTAAAGGDPLDYAGLVARAKANLVDRGWRGGIDYVFGSLLTALLLSFGAPLWNDIAKSVLRLKRGPVTDTDTVEGRT
jgi:hypothetical protein